MSGAAPRSLEERCTTCGRDALVHPFHSFLDFRSAAGRTKTGSRSARETADMAPPNPERDHASMRDGDTPHASASNRADPNPPPAEPAAAEPPCEACATPDPVDGRSWYKPSTEGPGIARVTWLVEAHHEVEARLRADNARLRSEVDGLVAALNREHDEVAGYRELLKLPISPKETCPTCASVAEARRVLRDCPNAGVK